MMSEIVVVIWIVKRGDDWWIGGLDRKGEFVIEEWIEEGYVDWDVESVISNCAN